MTAGTVVITGGILATVILLCIIAVLCYCRLQVLPPGAERGVRREPPTPPARAGAREGGKGRVLQKGQRRGPWPGTQMWGLRMGATGGTSPRRGHRGLGG